MRITESMEIPSGKSPIIAFVGGGGKSTSIYRLASELKTEGKKVLVTSTTMIFHPKIKKRPFDTFFTGSAEKFIRTITPPKGTITVAGRFIIEEGIKIKGFSLNEMKLIQISGLFDIILVEADGARGKPIKAPAEYEPVLPEKTDIVAGLIGMDALGTTINSKNVHRPELFKIITNSTENEQIKIDHIASLLNSPLGLFKNTSPKSRKIVIFNKSETKIRFEMAKQIASNIPESNNIERILISSMTGNDPVMAVMKL